MSWLNKGFYNKKKIKMPYRRTFRAIPRRRRMMRRSTKPSSKYAKDQQDAGMTYVRKRYCMVKEMACSPNSELSGATISLIGGPNSTFPD